MSRAGQPHRKAGRLLAVLGVALALAGCGGLPPGVDGNLTNDWSAMPLPKVAVPVAGVCYPGPYTAVWNGDFDTVDCAGSHQTETAYVGTFTGDDGQRSEPPPPGSPALRTAYTQCQQGASAYLGGDWHSALLSLGLVRPNPNAWTGGARWYRCDLIHWASLFSSVVVDHGSLKGDLAGARSAAYGCLATTRDASGSINVAKSVDCAAPHQAEYAGLYTAPDVPYPSDQAAQDRLETDGCKRVVASFLGFQDPSQWFGNGVGSWPFSFNPDQWVLGDRTIPCFAYAFTKSGAMVGTVKGIRNQTPKG